ncbi:MAG: NUDIX hydrolase [Rhodoglobus sp.]
MVQSNADLFDGPAVLCTDFRREATGGLIISWTRASYRYRVLRNLPDAPALSSVFVCVIQPTHEGQLLLGRMSTHTSSPGRIQLPGGLMEPPPLGEPLTLSSLRRHAAIELLEEVGINVPPENLDLFMAGRVTNGNAGFFFTAPALANAFVVRSYTELVKSEQTAGRESEFDDITFISQGTNLDDLDGTPADYLRAVVDKSFASFIG